MAHYRSARAFAVNPARLKVRPLRAAGLTAQRGQARGPSCQEWKEAPAEPNQPEDSTREQHVEKFTLDNESPIQGEEPHAPGDGAGDELVLTAHPAVNLSLST